MPHSGRNRPQAGRISFLEERRSRPEKSDFRLESSGPGRKVPCRKDRLWPGERNSRSGKTGSGPQKKIFRAEGGCSGAEKEILGWGICSGRISFRTEPMFWLREICSGQKERQTPVFKIRPRRKDYFHGKHI